MTTTSEKYKDCFGFTQEEVFASLEEFGLSGRKQAVKNWYDGFTFGSETDIYNPWSIINYLDKKKIGVYWANSSSNNLAGKLIQEGSSEIKQAMEELLSGKPLITKIDEQIVYSQLDENDSAVWSLLLAGGYLKVIYHGEYPEKEENGILAEPEYELVLTNLEVKLMFQTMIRGWFGKERTHYNDFIMGSCWG